MITPEAVKLQLLNMLPRYTDEFSTMVTDATAEVIAGDLIQCTKAAHGLVSGDVVSVASAEILVPISAESYDLVKKEITLTCSFDHDRTSGLVGKGVYNKAVLTGFDDPTYNDTFVIIEATDDTITFKVDAAPVGALGVMHEDRSLILGLSEATVVNDDTFTVPNVDTLIPIGGEFDDFSFATASRVVIAADPQRATNAFGQRANADPTLFIIFEQESASKDREGMSDAILALSPQNDMIVEYVPQITLLYMSSTKKDPLAGIVSQKIYAEIRPALRRSMFGHRFESVDASITFAAAEIANASVYYKTGGYVHSFVYQAPYKISLEQGTVDDAPNVSLRKVIMNSTMFDTEGALLSLEVDPEI